MIRHELTSLTDFDLDTLMGLVEFMARHETDGHITLLRFTGGWKVALGVPDLKTGERRKAVLRLPAYGELKNALVALLVR